MLQKRIFWIDFVKFFGILFILLNHMGIKIPIISQFGGMFYVPVFFVLAGYTFKIREETMKNFVARKARRLLIPYFGYSTFLLLFFWWKDGWQIKSLFGILYARNSMFTHLNTPETILMDILNSPLWFLPALFVTEVLFRWAVNTVKNDSRLMLLISAVSVFLGICFHYFSPVLLPWSLDSVFIFEAMMAMGYLLKEKNIIETYAKNCMVWILSLLLLCTLYFLNGPINISIGDYGKILWAGFFMAMISSGFVMMICYIVSQRVGKIGANAIGHIAQSSISIMCLHMFLFLIFETGMKWLNLYSPNGNSVGDELWKLLIVVVTMDVITVGRMIVIEGRKVETK